MTFLRMKEPISFAVGQNLRRVEVDGRPDHVVTRLHLMLEQRPFRRDYNFILGEQFVKGLREHSIREMLPQLSKSIPILRMAVQETA